MLMINNIIKTADYFCTNIVQQSFIRYFLYLAHGYS